MVATALQVAWALTLLWLGSFEKILIYASVGLALFSMFSVSSVMVLRHTRPDLHRPFRTPGYPVVPAIFLIGTTLLTIAAFVRAALAFALFLADHPRWRTRALPGPSAPTPGILSIRSTPASREN